MRSNGELERLKRPTTLADLLTHTYGLSYNFNMLFSGSVLSGEKHFNDPNISFEEMVEQIAALPLAFQPGESWDTPLQQMSLEGS